MDFSAIWANPDVALIMGGAFGGVTRALAVRPKLYDWVSFVIAGGILGYYVSPALAPTVAEWAGPLKVDHDKLPAFTAYIVGVGAIVIVGFFIDWWNERLRQIREKNGSGGPK